MYQKQFLSLKEIFNWQSNNSLQNYLEAVKRELHCILLILSDFVIYFRI